MKRKFLQILAISLLFVGCSKENNVHTPESKSEQDKRAELQKQVSAFSKFVDKKIKSDNITKGLPQQTTPPEFVSVIDDYVHYELPAVEPQYLWLQEDLQLQTVDQTDGLVELSDGLTDQQATNLIEANLYSTINFSNSVDFSSPAVKTNLKNIETSLVDAIKDDVKNAYLVNENNITEAQSEVMAEQAATIIRNKTKSVINGRIQSINAFPQGLTPQQASYVSMSLMASVSTVDDLVLMENLDGVITNDIFSVPPGPIPAKGLFSKIGKFFGKVIKSVAVVVASVAVVVVGTALGYISNHSNSNSSTNSDYTALTGALVGVGVVAKNSRSWWRWVGWNRW